MIAVVLLATLLALASPQVDHTPILPQISSVRIKPAVQTVPSRHSFTTTFPAIGY